MNREQGGSEALSDRLWTVAETIAPGFFDWFRSYRLRKYCCKQFKFDQRIFRVAFYPENMTPEVLTGPFRGMKYLDEIVWGPITPKWAGAYEMELADIVAGIPEVGYKRIVNIGCAEGYYVVGLALLDRKADFLAFDRDPFARRQLKRLAELNGVSERVRIAGNCTHRTLNEAIRGKVLVICDVEGFEAALIDRDKAPALRAADLLIEIHEAAASGEVRTVENLIASRFSSTHTVERRASFGREAWMEQHRSVWENKVSRERMVKSLDESRLGLQVWLWARAR
jgi:hypothetical protein